MRYEGTLLLVLSLLTACSEAPVPVERVSPSPLANVDTDRLWILARASRVGDGRHCDHVFTGNTNVVDHADRTRCEQWTVDYAAYLRVNGFPTLEAADLRSAAYWMTFKQTQRTLAACKTSVGTLAPDATAAERHEHTRQKNACDPYDDALNNYDHTPKTLGIRYPDV